MAPGLECANDAPHLRGERFGASLPVGMREPELRRLGFGTLTERRPEPLPARPQKIAHRHESGLKCG